MTAASCVTVCVPVCNGAPFAADTLASIANQTFPDLTVLVSDDASDDGWVDLYRPFARDSRFQLTIQPSRLGWIENCNWLLSRARGDFVCIVPHDDVLDRRYIEALVGCLSAEAACSLAFCDMQAFGLNDKILSQETISGGAVERLDRFIRRHNDGTAFRGLIRRAALDRAGGLRGNPADNFAADVTWLARIAGTGDLRRVEQVLYRKRYVSESISLRWSRWTDEDKIGAWCLHCGELLDVAREQDLTTTELRRIVGAVVRRLLAIEPEWPFPFIRDLPQQRKASMAATLSAPADMVASALSTEAGAWTAGSISSASPREAQAGQDS